MAVREIKFFSFKNLSVGKKLTAGFLSVVAVAIIITVVGVSGFNNIKENLRLERLTMEMVEDLGDARLNRTLLQYTGDLDYAKKNMIAVDHLRDKLQVLSGTDLGEEGNRTRDIASKKFVLYIAALADLTRSQEELQKTTAAADIYSLERARDNLDRSLRESALKADTERNMMLLEKDITSVISAAHVFMSKPDSAGYNDVISALNRADSTLSDLKTTGGHPLEALSNELSARIASMRPHLISCLNAATEEENRSKTLTKVSTEFRTSITDIFIYQQAKSSETVARARLQMILAASAGMVFALLTALWITRSITLPLRATLDAAKFISSGDLTHSISTDRTDEPGLLMQAVGIMNENLRQIIINVREGVGNVTRASAEIAAGNTDLSSRTEQQSAAVVETAASLEELSSTVRQTAGNAQEASRLAQDASRNAGEGGVIVGQVITTMKEIADSSLRISDIIGVINGIAFQTNILALNAAVEAARAGEHGRGFAVVAGEVRSLSQRSSTAAKEIEQLIQESGEKIANGSMLVNRAGDAMTGIVSSVLKVREIMAEIATASGEQSSGIEQINQAMSEMDTTTQQNAALVEESAASAEALDEHARSLEAKLSVFRLEKES